MSVASSGFDLKDAINDAEDRDVKGAAAEVEDQDIAATIPFLLVEAVGNGGGRGLVDDAEHVEAGNHSGILNKIRLN